jgi:LmbE family N-acetylglucosaminyl deacetylase
MRWIYLSPHYDDAVLCAGGLIREQTRSGAAVEIWTLMGGTGDSPEVANFAAGMHAKWGTKDIADTVAVRRAEDRRAVQLVGARARHFEFPDAIYRRGPDGTPLYDLDPIGAHLNLLDDGLPGQLAGALSPLLTLDDVVVSPLALGAHVDHVLTRRGAELLGRPLEYVADVPYVLKHPDDCAAAAKGLVERTEHIAHKSYSVWVKAIATYASQLTTVYASWKQLQADLERYWREREGIRIWASSGSSAAPGLDSGRKP